MEYRTYGRKYKTESLKQPRAAGRKIPSQLNGRLRSVLIEARHALSDPLRVNIGGSYFSALSRLVCLLQSL